MSAHEVMNVEKRLQLLYPGKHELKKYIENEIYVVLLKINLCENPEMNLSSFTKVLNGQRSEYVTQ
jgi:hypothetical protein